MTTLTHKKAMKLAITSLVFLPLLLYGIYTFEDIIYENDRQYCLSRNIKMIPFNSVLPHNSFLGRYRSSARSIYRCTKLSNLPRIVPGKELNELDAYIQKNQRYGSNYNFIDGIYISGDYIFLEYNFVGSEKTNRIFLLVQKHHKRFSIILQHT
jgi:hypothetical protein